MLLDDILDVVLDDYLDDADVGARVRGLATERLAAAARSDDERPPRDGGHLELMEARFSHVRSFAPQVLGALSFAASVVPSEVLDAVRLLQTMNAEGRRHVPDDAPIGVRPRPLAPLPRRRPRGRGREPVQALLGAVRAPRPPRRAALRGDLGARLTSLRQPRFLPRSHPRHGRAHRADVLELTGMPATFAERLAAHRGGDGPLPRRPGGPARRTPTARSASTKTASST